MAFYRKTNPTTWVPNYSCVMTVFGKHGHLFQSDMLCMSSQNTCYSKIIDCFAPLCPPELLGVVFQPWLVLFVPNFIQKVQSLLKTEWSAFC